mgnify:CR=1 FL=1
MPPAEPREDEPALKRQRVEAGGGAHGAEGAEEKEERKSRSASRRGSKSVSYKERETPPSPKPGRGGGRHGDGRGRGWSGLHVDVALAQNGERQQVGTLPDMAAGPPRYGRWQTPVWQVDEEWRNPGMAGGREVAQSRYGR